MVLRLQAVSIVDVVADDIRNILFSGQLGSGAQLTEAEVAATYGVARPTAKAAIEKLVAEGLLMRGTHKTARVPEMRPDDVRDLYFSRSCIEEQVVRRLAQQQMLPSAAVAANSEVIAAGKGAGSLIVEPVVRFHYALVSAVASPRINRLFATLMGEMRLCMAQMQSRQLLRGSVIAAEHRRILDRIAAGDADGAALALTEHLTRAENRLVPALERRDVKAAVESEEPVRRRTRPSSGLSQTARARALTHG